MTFRSNETLWAMRKARLSQWIALCSSSGPVIPKNYMTCSFIILLLVNNPWSVHIPNHPFSWMCKSGQLLLWEVLQTTRFSVPNKRYVRTTQWAWTQLSYGACETKNGTIITCHSGLWFSIWVIIKIAQLTFWLLNLDRLFTCTLVWHVSLSNKQTEV